VNPTAKGANPFHRYRGNHQNNEDAMYTDLALYIDGKWVNGGGRKGEEVLNPATEKPLAHLPHASKADLDEALAAAKRGFALWRATSA
jgi:succinate-semialdehyde dehydrogenase / glutarate-semialdehyde dehydrogenase